MRDPIDSLTHLSPGDSVDQPPASEIRRRGTARRSRRTATIAVGAAAAVAAVLVPAALLNRPEIPIDPATDDPSTQVETSLTTVPDEFLDSGLLRSDDTYIEITGPGRGLSGLDLELCGQQVWPVETLDAIVERGILTDSTRIAELATFENPEAASAAVQQLASAAEACPETEIDGTLLDVATVPADTGHETLTLALTQATDSPGGLVVQATRVGTALLVLTVDGTEVAADSAPVVVDELSEQSRELATEMCMFTEAGC